VVSRRIGRQSIVGGEVRIDLSKRLNPPDLPLAQIRKGVTLRLQ